ncbi:mCG1047497 [Mus musculus]|nr:mCG1047497 [Mus musculus]
MATILFILQLWRTAIHNNFPGFNMKRSFASSLSWKPPWKGCL